MAYSQELAERVADALGARAPYAERKMFGGLALMVDGHMCVGVMGDELIARVGREAGAAALTEPGVREMDFTGRPMGGFVLVGPTATDDDRALAGWVDRCLAFVATLPPRR